MWKSFPENPGRITFLILTLTEITPTPLYLHMAPSAISCLTMCRSSQDLVRGSMVLASGYAVTSARLFKSDFKWGRGDDSYHVGATVNVSGQLVLLFLTIFSSCVKILGRHPLRDVIYQEAAGKSVVLLTFVSLAYRATLNPRLAFKSASVIVASWKNKSNRHQWRVHLGIA